MASRASVRLSVTTTARIDVLVNSPERSKRVAVGEGLLGIGLVVVGLVTGVWFAYIVAALVFLFGAFVWVRAKQEIERRGGDNGALR
jgi:hypothetical protein